MRVGRRHTRTGATPIGAMEVLTPDDIMAGTRPEGGQVAVYANRPAGSAQRGDGCVVVGLGGDLGDQLGMQHGAV